MNECIVWPCARSGEVAHRVNHFQDTGRDPDPEVGLQYNMACHYDPTIGLLNNVPLTANLPSFQPNPQSLGVGQGQFNVPGTYTYSYYGWWTYLGYGGTNLDGLAGFQSIDAYRDKLLAQTSAHSAWADPQDVAPVSGAIGSIDVNPTTQFISQANILEDVAGVSPPVVAAQQSTQPNSLKALKTVLQQVITQEGYESVPANEILAKGPVVAPAPVAALPAEAANPATGLKNPPVPAPVQKAAQAPGGRTPSSAWNKWKLNAEVSKIALTHNKYAYFIPFGLGGYFFDVLHNIPNINNIMENANGFATWGGEALWAPITNTLYLRGTISSTGDATLMHEMTHMLDDFHDWYISPFSFTDTRTIEGLGYATAHIFDNLSSLQQFETKLKSGRFETIAQVDDAWQGAWTQLSVYHDTQVLVNNVPQGFITNADIMDFKRRTHVNISQAAVYEIYNKMVQTYMGVSYTLRPATTSVAFR